MIFERQGAKQVANGKNGRTYVIEYVPGARRPWIVNGNTEYAARSETLEAAMGRAHELEGAALSREEDERW